MFILSNSYQIKDIKNDIFRTVFDAKSPISYFATTEEIQAFSVGTDLFSFLKNKSKKMADLKSEITCLTAQSQLICAGTKSGEVHLFSEHRTSIRQFKNHSADIMDIIITPSNLVITSGKDGKINIYELAEGLLKHTIEMKAGYTRKLISCDDILVAFSKNISIYSSVDFSLIKEISIGNVVEHAIKLSEKTLFFTSHNKGFLLDLETFEISLPVVLHTREISMVQFFDNKIYTSSIDGHLKSFTQQLKCISDINFISKITSFSMLNGIPLVVAFDGRILGIENKKDIKEQRKIRSAKAAYEEEIEYELVQSNKKKFSEIDMMLRNYEYKGALKLSIATNDISKTYAVLNYVSEKRELMKVVADSDLDFLRSLLQMCLETIKISEFTSIIVELLTILTSRFFDQITCNDDLKSMIDDLGDEINEIVAFEEIYLKALSFAESFPEE
jgi:hypothetical protein